MSPTEKQQRIDRFFAAHRERGLPVTTQRRAVFEAILDRRDHPRRSRFTGRCSPDSPRSPG